MRDGHPDECGEDGCNRTPEYRAENPDRSHLKGSLCEKHAHGHHEHGWSIYPLDEPDRRDDLGSIECDRCGETAEIIDGIADWRQVSVEDLSNRGGVLLHCCPSCSEKLKRWFS